MLHISCDLCGRELRKGIDHHYVVKIETFADFDPSELTEDDLEDDHLEAISQILCEMEDNSETCSFNNPTRHFRYDLCHHCQQKFVNDPLGRGQLEKLNFSEN